MPRIAMAITLTLEEQQTLEAVVRTRTAPYRAVQRARVVLLAAAGKANTAIAQEVGLSRTRVVGWRQRFTQERLTGLEDRPRPGRKAVYWGLGSSLWRRFHGFYQRFHVASDV
ncbi:MAG: helix-turn-helix domain-containing protein [Chloroflexi bacterium]|nr:helix-turn-helix domain-containing protein [Chloroflexota bacterium]